VVLLAWLLKVVHAEKAGIVQVGLSLQHLTAPVMEGDNVSQDSSVQQALLHQFHAQEEAIVINHFFLVQQVLVLQATTV
jgi:hypothetical protein